MITSRATFLDTIIHGIPFHSLEAGVFDHGDEFLFGHFDLAVFDGVAVGEFAAVIILSKISLYRKRLQV